MKCGVRSMPNRRFMLREFLKLIWMNAEDDVMKSCFYCRKCGKCNKFYEIMDECNAKGFLSFNKEVKNYEVIYRGKKNKHFKIKPRD